MEHEEIEWVEITLQEAERRKSVRRILSAEKFAAVEKGDNYTSDLSRLRLRVQQIDGQVLNRWVIYKTLPNTELRHKYMKETAIFTVEIRMYNEVLPLLEMIRQEKEGGEPLWGECYGVRGHEALLLEDLSVKGYKMGQRKKGLDFAHSSLVMRALGKYHALTAILRERGDLILADYEKHFLEKNFPMVEKFYTPAFEELAQSLESKWDKEWECYGKPVREMGASLKENLLKDFVREDDRFNVLNHGDCWVNNLLFKYDDEGRPLSMRFVDFQVCFYNSPGFDLQYFINTSLQFEARSHTDELVKLYHDSLVANLQLFGYAGRLPTMEDISDGLRKASLFGLAQSIMLLPLMMVKSEDVPDMEDLLKQDAENHDLTSAFLPADVDAYRKAIGANLIASREKGIIQL